MMKMKEIMKTAKAFEERNRPTILAGIAIVGVWVTAYMSYKAGIKAKDIVKDAKDDFKEAEDRNEKMSVAKNTVKKMAPVVLPSIVSGGVTTACMVLSHQEHAKRLATVSAAYAVTDAAYREFKNKLEEVDKAKAQRTRELISKDKVDNLDIPDDDTLIEKTKGGNVLCYDEYTDKLFYSSSEAISQAALAISYRIQSEMWISLNEFRYELGLKPCKMGDDLGWNVDNIDKGRIPIYYTAILTDDNRPCLALHYDVELRKREW